MQHEASSGWPGQNTFIIAELPYTMLGQTRRTRHPQPPLGRSSDPAASAMSRVQGALYKPHIPSSPSCPLYCGEVARAARNAIISSNLFISWASNHETACCLQCAALVPIPVRTMTGVPWLVKNHTRHLRSTLAHRALQAARMQGSKQAIMHRMCKAALFLGRLMQTCFGSEVYKLSYNSSEVASRK